MKLEPFLIGHHAFLLELATAPAIRDTDRLCDRRHHQKGHGSEEGSSQWWRLSSKGRRGAGFSKSRVFVE